MNYKLYIYVISILLCTYALTGIDFEKFLKSHKPVEARVLVIILILVLSYLLTSFITDFLSISKII